MVSPGNIRLALAILVITAIIGIVAAIALKGSHQAALPEPVSRQLPQNIDMAIHNARFYEVREGTAVWELVAKQAEYDKNGDVANLSDIRMEFARTATAGAITVTAAQGTYSSKSRNVALRGKVHVVTETGVIFDTETVDYVAARSLFRTSDKVAFRQQRLTLTARGMELDVKSQKARFLKDVDAGVAGSKSHR
ncbi:LPS export ABC transporter periplasmic protein LptC [Oryzomonas rubra]|uniref:LPS export ABC transporter periplasmic protein LptC n=1 Tax=Oryzomonas rubra TaxID=2509454 RepID=A0A5A9XQD4_9BACT|nr:LPS export ABC transporter periplasmic protein LptC [Oryzomonas rubra]